MKVCVTAGAPGLDSNTDPRLGRSPYFVIVDTDSMIAESVANTGANEATGAGILAAQTVARLGASILLTGNVGPNAMRTLLAGGIEVYQVAGGTVKDAVERFKRGELHPLTTSTMPPHGGMMQGGPGGRGMGRGRGGGGRGGGGIGGPGGGPQFGYDKEKVIS